MYKNDADEELLGLSEKELLIAILKSQAGINRRLMFLEEYCSKLQKELILDESKRYKFENSPKYGDAFLDVIETIEAVSEIGGTRHFTEDDFEENKLSAIKDLKIEHLYIKDKE